MMDKLEKKILEDIEKTGFVTELKTVSLLMEKDWRTNHSGTYEDKDQNLNREIDVVASKVIYDKELGFRFVFYLIIETKKSERPWIIFTTYRKYGTIAWGIMHENYNSDKKVPLPDGGHYFSTIFDVDCVASNSIREENMLVGKAFHELGKNPEDKSKIYGALMSVCKAARYYCDTYKRGEPPFDLDPKKVTEVIIYLPTIVLDGQLFEVYNEMTTGNIKTQKQPYIPVEMDYSSPNYRQGKWDTSFYPDIVTFDHFPKHLENIEKWRMSMFEKMKAILKKEGKEPEGGL